MKLFTVGYGGRRPQEFIELLTACGIKTIVDVRLRPDRASLGSYSRAGSDDKGIARLLSSAGIGYVSFVELGNVFIDCPDWPERYKRLWERAGEILAERFLAAVPSLPQPFCLLCAEKETGSCHRRFLAAFLADRGFTVEHIR
jgi:uncharacterized protein (DUF488 family)